jgi:hypothetical protein
MPVTMVTMMTMMTMTMTVMTTPDDVDDDVNNDEERCVVIKLTVLMLDDAWDQEDHD